MELIKVGQSAGVRLDAVNRSRITIGRSRSCDIVVSDATVSREHAVLDRIGDRWRLRDVGSQNGVFLNGIRIHRSTPLRSGDGIRLGDAALRLTESVDDTPADMATIHASPASHPGGLSPREREVLGLLASGHKDSEIADALTVSVKTVRSHLDRIRDKTGARRRAELTTCAIGLGLGPDANGAGDAVPDRGPS